MTRRRSARDVATALLWHQTTLIRFFDAAAWTTSTSVNSLFTQWRGHADGTLSVAVSCQFVWSISRKKILCTVTCVLLSMLISSVNILRSKWHLTPILRKQKKSQQSQQNWNLTVEFLVKNCRVFFWSRTKLSMRVVLFFCPSLHDQYFISNMVLTLHRLRTASPRCVCQIVKNEDRAR